MKTCFSLIVWSTLSFLIVLAGGLACSSSDDDDNNTGGGIINQADGAETATAMAAATLEAIEVFREEGFPRSAASGGTRLPGGSADVGAEDSAETIFCTTGGTIRRTVDVSGGSCIQTLSFSQCTEPVAEGVFETANGTLRLTTTDLSVCESFGDGFQVGEFELEASPLEILTHDGSISLGRNFVRGVASGTTVPSECLRELDSVYTFGGQIEWSSREDDIDLKLVATDLELAFTFRPAGDVSSPCDLTVDLVGRLDFQDVAENTRVILDYKEFSASDRGGEDGERLLTLSGIIGMSCLGDVRYETVDEIVLPEEGCPTGGRLRVRVLNLATTSAIVFRPDGGADILAEDGTLLRSFASCEDIDFQGGCKL